MSKNIVIQEGGVGRQFTAQKLITALVGGGSCNWIPEDEVQLGTKSITENGTYVAANDGEYGYSQVTVNVNSTTKIITGSTNDGTPAVATIDVVDGNISQIILGDYFIVTYDEDGKVAKIEDNNGNACTLVYDGETLSGFDDVEDNHYTIVLDSDGNISQVIDPNAQDCELRDSDGDGKIDIISVGAVLEVVPDIETGDIKIIDVNDNDVTDEYIGTTITGVDNTNTPWRANIVSDVDTGGASVGITPVTPATTPGASVLGIDKDGDAVVATIDDDNNINVRKLPESIKVTTPPTKTEYDAGETIITTGMVVRAFIKDNTLWDDKDYPSGIIPLSEIVLPKKKAGQSGIKHRASSQLDVGNIEMPVPFNKGSAYGVSTTGDGWTVVDAPYIAHLQINAKNVTILTISETPNSTAHMEICTELGHKTEVDVALNTQFTYNGKTVYYSTSGPYDAGYYSKDIGHLSPQSMQGTSPRWGEIAWTIVYGDEIMVEDILVQWNRPNDRKLLKASFEIIVIGNDGEGGEGGESGDDEGGSEPTIIVPDGITIQDLNIAIYNAMNAGQEYIYIYGKQYTLAEAQAMIDYLISH